VPTTNPRQSVTQAFKTILDQASIGVTVYEEMPVGGAPQRSVVFTLVTGTNRSPAIGMQFSDSVRALEESFRLQIDCYYDDPDKANALSDHVQQIIADSLDVLRDAHDIHDIRKVIDTNMPAEDPSLKEWRKLMQYTFYTHRAIT
jgi:hypothetical protein